MINVFRGQAQDDRIRRVLLVRPDGLGDQILCLPAASSLRRKFPGVRISFLSSGTAAPLFDHHPDIDDVLILQGQERFKELVALFRQGFDAAVFFKPYRQLIMAAFVARVRVRVATGYRWYSIFVNRRVFEHRHDFSKHESQYNLNLLKGFGFDPGPVVPPTLVVTEQEREAAKAIVSEVPHPKVIIHPGGRSTRRWRSESYWHLGLQLAAQGFGVVLTGSAAEGKSFLEDVGQPQSMPKGLLNLMGRLTLRELMGVIAASQAVVSGSTGPAHIAAALEVPMVSIYDPRRLSEPTRWRPLGTGVVLKPDVPSCPRCIEEACPYWDCLDRITVENVGARVAQVIERAEPLKIIHV